MATEKLPDGWRRVKFDEMVLHFTEKVKPQETDLKVYVGLEHLDPNSLRIKRHGTPDDVIGQKLRVKPRQIIFGKRRAYQRKLAVSHFDGICSAHAMILEANASTVVPEFLPFFMQSDLFFDRALAISEGSLSPTIKWKTLAQQVFPIPPIERQRELVEVFSALEETIRCTEEAIESAEQLKGSLMAELLTRGIGHARFKQTEIGEIPEAWKVRKLGEISDFLDEMRKPIKESDRAKMQGKYPYYGASGIIDYVNDYIFDEELILMGEDGANIIDRNLPLVFRASGKYWVNNHAHVIRPNLQMDIVYLTEYLEYLDYAKYNTGTAQPKLNKAVCLQIDCVCPPLSEQQKIAAVLSAADSEIETLESERDALKTQKRGLMRKLLIGRKD